MQFLSLILGFVWHLLSGEAFFLWKEHKNKEAQNAAQQDLVDDGADAQRKLHEWKPPS